MILKITVLDHKVKTSSTFLVTENEGLDSPTGLSVFSNWFYAFYIIEIYITHITKQSRLRLTNRCHVCGVTAAGLHGLPIWAIGSNRCLLASWKRFSAANGCFRDTKDTDWLCHNREESGPVSCAYCRGMLSLY